MTDPKFMTPPHRRAYLTHLNRCKVMDSYHRARIYILTAVPALRNNIDACFNFEKDEIKPESLAAGWQTSGTTKLTRFAYNLWNGYDDKSCTPYDLFDCSFAPYMYEAVKLRYFGRCPVTLTFPVILVMTTLSVTPAIAVRTFPRRREPLSSPPTAARSSFPAGTTAMATKSCWTTARACPRATPI